MSPLLKALFCLLFAASVARADALVASVQKELQKEGFYQGTVDGLMGSQTAAAIRRYQLANHLKVDGKLNDQTIESLGMAPAPVPEHVAIADIFRGGPYLSAGPEVQISTIRQAQRNLKLLGYYGGPINGSPTEALVTALKAWQKSAGFRQTGRFDETTLKGLSLMPD